MEMIVGSSQEKKVDTIEIDYLRRVCMGLKKTNRKSEHKSM